MSLVSLYVSGFVFVGFSLSVFRRGVGSEVRARVGQPMADPSPPPEAVGAGPGLVTNNDEPQMALESDSRDCVGSNNPSYDMMDCAFPRDGQT